tara:strand:- start:53 stop:424 length:372 start_codon:yes stop_codon:yes gene_type:complete
MKIRSAQLRKLIRELASLNEVEYDEHGPMYTEPDPSGAPTPDEAEVLVQGYGGLLIRQIKKGAVDRISTLAQAARRKADGLDAIADVVSTGDYAQALEDLEYYGDSQGVATAFLKTLVDHNAT